MENRQNQLSERIDDICPTDFWLECSENYWTLGTTWLAALDINTCVVFLTLYVRSVILLFFLWSSYFSSVCYYVLIVNKIRIGNALLFSNSRCVIIEFLVEFEWNNFRIWSQHDESQVLQFNIALLQPWSSRNFLINESRFQILYSWIQRQFMLEIIRQDTAASLSLKLSKLCFCVFCFFQALILIQA